MDVEIVWVDLGTPFEKQTSPFLAGCRSQRDTEQEGAGCILQAQGQWWQLGKDGDFIR